MAQRQGNFSSSLGALLFLQPNGTIATTVTPNPVNVTDTNRADPNLPSSEQTTARFFNTAAFVQAPQFTIGNSSRNPVRGPKYQNADIALIKRIALGETRNVELRAEAFNVTNTPPLGAPNVVLNSAGFGSITSAGDPRVVQLGIKLNF